MKKIIEVPLDDCSADQVINPPIELNKISKKKLVSALGGYSDFVDIVIENRPYGRSEDLLNVSELQSVEWAYPLIQLIINARGTAQDEQTEYSDSEISCINPSGVEYGVRISPSGRRNLFIIHPTGLELVSADITSRGRIDYSTFRWLSHSLSGLCKLDLETLKTLYSILQSMPALQAGFLWRQDLKGIKDKAVRKGISHLSQNLRGLQDFTQYFRGEFRQSSEMPPRQPPNPETDFLTNGCTKIPNFDFVECCKKHDICYSDKGNTFLGRLECDWELFKCIASESPFIPLSVVYFIGVRLLGPFVSKGEAIVPVQPKPTFVPPPTFDVIRNCKYIITMKSVSYLGDDIDKDKWEFEFGTDPQNIDAKAPEFTMKLGRTYLFNGGSGIQIYNSEQKGDRHRCFDTIKNHKLWINVLNTPVGKQFFLDIICCPAPPVVPYLLVVPVTLDGTLPLFKRGTAKLRFDVEVSGRCTP